MITPITRIMRFEKRDNVVENLPMENNPPNQMNSYESDSSATTSVDRIEKEITILGRTPRNWAKILSFYVLFYTTISAIAYFYVTYYERTFIHQKCRKDLYAKPKTNSRLTQPGSSSVPFGDIKIFAGNLGNTANADDKKFNSQTYVENLISFANEQKKIQKACQKCEKNSSCYDCDSANLNLLTEKNIKIWAKNYQPVVLLKLNRIIDWKPINKKVDLLEDTNLKENNDDEMYKNFIFKKDSVFVKCYHVNLCGARIPDDVSNFEIKYLKDSQIFINGSQGRFPYKGFHSETFLKKLRDESWSNTTYLTQFVPIQISLKERKVAENYQLLKTLKRFKNFNETALKLLAKSWNGPILDNSENRFQPNYFDCYFTAENLNKPKMPDLLMDGDDERWVDRNILTEPEATETTNFIIKIDNRSNNLQLSDPNNATKSAKNTTSVKNIEESDLNLPIDIADNLITKTDKTPPFPIKNANEDQSLNRKQTKKKPNKENPIGKRKGQLGCQELSMPDQILKHKRLGFIGFSLSYYNEGTDYGYVVAENLEENSEIDDSSNNKKENRLIQLKV